MVHIETLCTKNSFRQRIITSGIAPPVVRTHPFLPSLLPRFQNIAWISYYILYMSRGKEGKKGIGDTFTKPISLE
jgi:hypothetical protein